MPLAKTGVVELAKFAAIPVFEVGMAAKAVDQPISMSMQPLEQFPQEANQETGFSEDGHPRQATCPKPGPETGKITHPPNRHTPRIAECLLQVNSVGRDENYCSSFPKTKSSPFAWLWHSMHMETFPATFI